MRLFLATVVGIIVGSLGVWIFELLGHKIFPIPFKIDVNNIDDFKLMMFKIPFKSLMAVVVAHGMGVWLGMMATRFIDKSTHAPMYGVSSFLMLFTVINLMMIPHPLWFTLADIGIILGVTIAYVATRKKA